MEKFTFAKTHSERLVTLVTLGVNIKVGKRLMH